jgi:hypothetical protein
MELKRLIFSLTETINETVEMKNQAGNDDN